MFTFFITVTGNVMDIITSRVNIVIRNAITLYMSQPELRYLLRAIDLNSEIKTKYYETK